MSRELGEWISRFRNSSIDSSMRPFHNSPTTDNPINQTFAETFRSIIKQMKWECSTLLELGIDMPAVPPGTEERYNNSCHDSKLRLRRQHLSIIPSRGRGEAKHEKRVHIIWFSSISLTTCRCSDSVPLVKHNDKIRIFRDSYILVLFGAVFSREARMRLPKIEFRITLPKHSASRSLTESPVFARPQNPSRTLLRDWNNLVRKDVSCSPCFQGKQLKWSATQ